MNRPKRDDEECFELVREEIDIYFRSTGINIDDKGYAPMDVRALGQKGGKGGHQGGGKGKDGIGQYGQQQSYGFGGDKGYQGGYQQSERGGKGGKNNYKGDNKGGGKKGGKAGKGKSKGKGKTTFKAKCQGYCGHCEKWGHKRADCFARQKQTGGVNAVDYEWDEHPDIGEEWEQI